MVSATDMAVLNDIPLYIVAGVGFLATMTSPIVSATYIARSNRKAAAEAAAAQKQQAEDAADEATKVARAQQQTSSQALLAARSAGVAANAAQEATEAAASTLVKNQSAVTQRLDELQTVAAGTHVLVNAQHTALLGTVASLARVIAHQNPDDAEAQVTAIAAEAEYDKSKAAAEAIAASPSGIAAKQIADKDAPNAG